MVKLLIAATVCFFLVMALGATDAGITYTIDGNTVYINLSGKGMITQTPHTITGFSGQPEISFTSYFSTTRSLDFVFGFDTDSARPTKCDYYNSNTQEVQKSYTCPSPYWYNYTLSPKHFYCWHTYNDNITTRDILIYDHAFSSYSGDTAYWTETETIGWQDISNRFTTIDYDYSDKNLWYIIDSVTFAPGETKTIRPTIKLKSTIGENSGKYDICIKPSSLTISQAVQQNLFVCLDPWWNTSFSNRKPIRINATDGATLTSFPIMLNVTYTSGMDANFEDLRFTNNCSDDATELDYWVEAEYASGYADVWVEVNTINTTICMYYNATGLTNTSNIGNTFLLGDDFNRADNATVGNGWVETEASGGTASIERDMLKLYDDGTSKYVDVDKTFSATEAAFLRFRLNESVGGTTGSTARLSDGDHLGSISQFNSGTFRAYAGTTATTYSAYTTGTWQLYEVRLNQSLEKHSGWLNGSAAFTAIDTYQAQNDLTTVRVGTPGTSGWTTYFDWIIVDQYHSYTSYAFDAEETSGGGAPPAASTVNVSLYLPNNTTYTATANPHTMTLTVDANTTISTWLYSVNGAANVTFTPNTTFSAPINQQSNITVYANDTATGAWGTQTVVFTVLAPTPELYNYTFASNTEYIVDVEKYLYFGANTSISTFYIDGDGTNRTFTNGTRVQFMGNFSTINIWANASIGGAWTTLQFTNLTFTPYAQGRYSGMGRTGATSYYQNITLYETNTTTWYNQLITAMSYLSSIINISMNATIDGTTYTPNYNNIFSLDATNGYTIDAVYTLFYSGHYYTINITPDILAANNTEYPYWFNWTVSASPGYSLCGAGVYCFIKNNFTGSTIPLNGTEARAMFAYYLNGSADNATDVLETSDYNFTSYVVDLLGNATLTPYVQYSGTNYSLTSAGTVGYETQYYRLFNLATPSGWNDSHEYEPMLTVAATGLGSRSTVGTNETATVYKLGVTDCNTVDGENESLYIMSYDSINGSFTNATLSLVYDVSHPSLPISNNYAFGQSGDTYNHSQCIYPGWATALVNADIYYTQSGYSSGMSFLMNTTLNDTTQTHDIFLTPDAYVTQVTIQVKDMMEAPRENVIVDARKLNSSSGTYDSITMGITDSDGYTILPLEANEWYRFYLTEVNGTFLKYTSPKIITLTSYIIYVGDTELIKFWQYYGKVSGDCSYSNTTYMLSCTFTDTSGYLSNTTLSVQKKGPLTFTQICTNYSTAATDSLTCNLTGYNGTIFYSLVGSFDTDPETTDVLTDGWLDLGGSILDLSQFGILMAFMLFLIMVGLGAYNPVISASLGAISLVLSAYLGLLAVSTSALIGLIFAIAVYVYKMRA